MKTDEENQPFDGNTGGRRRTTSRTLAGSPQVVALCGMRQHTWSQRFEFCANAS